MSESEREIYEMLPEHLQSALNNSKELIGYIMERGVVNE